MPINVKIHDGIGEIIFDHPPVNAFDSKLWMELPELVTSTASNPEVKVVLIRAEGKGFQAGVDIKELQAKPDMIPLVNRGNFLTGQAIHKAEVPVVCAVHGFIMGGGVIICGASDTIIASEDAFFALPEIDRGAMGGASHLSRMLPLHKVRAAFFTGSNITADEMYRLGAVEKVVPKDKLYDEALAFCRVIASKSRKALTIAKEALNGIEAADVDRNYRWEQGFTLEMYMEEDSQKARDAFVEGGKKADF